MLRKYFSQKAAPFVLSALFIGGSLFAMGEAASAGAVNDQKIETVEQSKTPPFTATDDKDIKNWTAEQLWTHIRSLKELKDNDARRGFYEVRHAVHYNEKLLETALEEIPRLFDSGTWFVWKEAIETYGWFNKEYPAYTDVIYDALVVPRSYLQERLQQEKDEGKNQNFIRGLAFMLGKIGYAHADHVAEVLKSLKPLLSDDSYTQYVVMERVYLLSHGGEKAAQQVFDVLAPLVDDIEKMEPDNARQYAYALGEVSLSGGPAVGAQCLDILEKIVWNDALPPRTGGLALMMVRSVGTEYSTQARRVVDFMKDLIEKDRFYYNALMDMYHIAKQHHDYLPEAYELFSRAVLERKGHGFDETFAVIGQDYPEYSGQVLDVFETVLAKDCSFLEYDDVAYEIAKIGMDNSTYLERTIEVLNVGKKTAIEKNDLDALRNVENMLGWLMDILEKNISKQPATKKASAPSF